MATKKDAKFKEGISAILNKKTEKKERPKSVIIDPETTPKAPTPVKPVVVPKETTSKPGRKRKLESGIKYVGVGSRIKETTKDRMKVALVTNLKKDFASQDLFVDYAINFALDSLAKKKK